MAGEAGGGAGQQVGGQHLIGSAAERADDLFKRIDRGIFTAAFFFIPGFEQRLFKRAHRLKAGRRMHRQGAQQVLFHFRGNVGIVLRRRHQGIAFDPVDGIRHRVAGEGEIQGSRQGVDIRPWSRDADIVEQLLGRVAGAEDRAQNLPAPGDHKIAAAEIDQFGGAVGIHQEIIGVNIEMQQAPGVHLLQAAHHRGKHGDHLVEGGFAAVLDQVIAQGDGIDILIHPVGGAVLAEKIEGVGQSRLGADLLQYRGLFRKLAQAVAKVRLRLDIVDDDIGIAGKAGDDILGEKFLHHAAAA